MPTDKIEVENINHPGQIARVDARKYAAAKTALLSVLPNGSPGLTQKEMLATVKIVIDSDLFPNGEKSGWWAKTVQLDLEAKGLICRQAGTPLRWYLSG